MDALVYEGSPLADIVEGDATPFQTPQSPRAPPQQYAPRGLPRLQNPLHFIRCQARLLTDSSEAPFLERFRYIIVASQLLTHNAEPRGQKSADDATTALPFSLRGAYVIVSLSFSFAWLLSWLRARLKRPAKIESSEAALFVLVAVSLSVCLVVTARRQYLKFVRQSALAAASRLVSESQDFDSSTSAALRYIQEIEVVAKGYDLSHPLPPVSRLDEKYALQQCRELRAVIAKSLTTGIAQFVHFHNQLQLLVDRAELDTYYHIYELSSESFAETINYANELSVEARDSLRQLRFLFELHAVARRFFLVDLLAVKAFPLWSDVARWRKVAQILQTIAEDSLQMLQALRLAQHREESFADHPLATSLQGDTWPARPADSPGTLENAHLKAQMRRLDTLVLAIRALNAKAKIARDDVAGLLTTTSPGETAVSASTAKHYDALGSELRSILVEWEQGRNAMLAASEPDPKSPLPGSIPRTPISPSPSLGGLTMVDGGPAEALRLLNGDDDSDSLSLSGLGGEVFEAVAKPRKRMSPALTREEKIAKLQEDRRKRATLQEQADTTTNMLRELQMVIKHRPSLSRPVTRVSSP
ncbi:hypothetical protein DV737_g3286, partial [Chaetothyriales sp. CBS 132003]